MEDIANRTTDISHGGTGATNAADALINLGAMPVNPMPIDVTTDIHGLASGLYSAEGGGFSETNNFPPALSGGWYHILVEIMSNAPGSPGYGVIRIADNYGNMYMQAQSWSNWSAWRTVSMA